MFVWLTRKLRFKQLARYWQEVTGVDLDADTLEKAAIDLMNHHRIGADDAWLGALVSQIYTCTGKHTRRAQAEALNTFIYNNQKFRFDEEAAGSALLVAHQILNDA